MAGKRSATSDLNHDNWDQEDESEEAGQFKTAPPEVLKHRVIKSAKRRTAGLSGDEKPTANVFSSFTGFSKNTVSSATNSASNLFNFLTKSGNSPQTGISNGIETSDQAKKINTETDSNENKKSAEYYAKLKGLNESVSQWIKTHVDSNPICILTPIFKDYEKYLNEIEETDNEKLKLKESVEIKSSKQDLTVENSVSKSIFPQSTFSFGVKNTSDTNSPLSSIKFDDTKDSETNSKEKQSTSDSEPIVKKTVESATPFVTPFSNTAAFSFGSSTPASGSFSFGGSGQPFKFVNVSAPTSESTDAKPDEEESDEPPKVEFTPVVEDGSIYNIKCKLFAKKDSEFVERGVGQLYLKPVEGSEKFQLIVRADTNLGNLLMNVILSKSIPLSRKGKNNVMIVCIPTPEETSKKPNPMQTILIKVKTAEDADKLIEILEKHKK